MNRNHYWFNTTLLKIILNLKPKSFYYLLQEFEKFRQKTRFAKFHSFKLSHVDMKLTVMIKQYTLSDFRRNL